MKVLKIGVLVKKIICAECEKVYMLHPEALKNFECDECGCGDYKDWGFKSDKTILIKKPLEVKTIEKNEVKAPLVSEKPKVEEIIEDKVEENDNDDENLDSENEDYDLENYYHRNSLVRELAPYIKEKVLKEITVKYAYNGVDVSISLKNGEDYE